MSLYQELAQQYHALSAQWDAAIAEGDDAAADRLEAELAQVCKRLEDVS